MELDNEVFNMNYDRKITALFILPGKHQKLQRLLKTMVKATTSPSQSSPSQSKRLFCALYVLIVRNRNLPLFLPLQKNGNLRFCNINPYALTEKDNYFKLTKLSTKYSSIIGPLL